jgi:endonuclease/exonuclease/phosphatase (EEP) superfamily protein YafD
LTVVASHPVPPISATNTSLRNQQVMELSRFLAGTEGPTILMADLNMTPWSPTFETLLDQSGLHNTGLGWGLQATWPAGVFLLRVPIDHVLVSPGVMVLNRMIGPHLGSDHLPVIIDLLVR